MERRGTIRKIYVKNFGTFGEVELYPGANLNLILGPNGTGKSTIVSAIVLGLGGHPKVIGRASQIGDYVKRNCHEAIMEIEINTGDDNQNIITVHREITTNNNSTWRLNGKSISHKQIMEIISSYNIQVDNLCQFLPQDRVQDFARMNNQELLLNTQKSVGTNLATDHEILIELRHKHKAMIGKLKAYDKLLEDEEQKNSRITGAVKNIEKRKVLTESLKHVQGKLAWINYDQLRTSVLEIKKDRETMEKSIKKYTLKIKPMEDEINSIKNQVSVMQQKYREKNQTASEIARQLRQNIEQSQDVLYQTKSIKNVLQQKIQEEENRQEAINQAKLKVKKLQTDLDNIIDQYGTVDNMRTEINNLIPKLKLIEKQNSELSLKKGTIDFKIEQINMEMHNYQQEINDLQNVARQKLQLLQRIDEDAYKCVLWFRQNRQMFKGKVYEPIILEINVTNPENSRFLENLISGRDLSVFTCEEIDDMNLLIRNLRVQQKLRVSVVHSGQQHTPYHKYTPPLPLNQIRQYGFHAYANTLVTGPEAIMKYLCRSCRLHAIPIGTAQTDDVYESIPSKINLFFSDSKRYHVSVSSYTNEKSIRISDIIPTRMLALSVNTEAVAKVTQRIQILQQQKQTINQEIQNIDTQLENIATNRRDLMKTRSDFNTNISQFEQIKSRLQIAQKNFNSLEETHHDIELEKSKCQEKLCKVFNEIFKLQAEHKPLLKKHLAASLRAKLAKEEMDLTSSKTIHLREELHAAKETIDKLTASLANIKAKFESSRLEAKAEYDKAKAFTDGFTPGDKANFQKFDAIFEKLPSEIESLSEKLSDIETKLECMSDLNDDVIREYEDRLKLITKTQKDKETIIVEIEKALEKITEVNNRWIDPLQTLIVKISKRFAKYYETMGCTGNVSLMESPDPLDFVDYGLSIKVSYRKGEPMQELDPFTQSGGERAVATAIFMLSLQELTQVPFRCVDEINQGMDAVNERKVFEMIVNSTSDNNTSQYFLLTPKLLPNLTYTKNMRIHVIHNGPYECQGKHYDFKIVSQALKIRNSQQSMSATQLTGSQCY